MDKPTLILITSVKAIGKCCACGCGKLINNADRPYLPGHNTLGKTYKEIHGDKEVTCGYQKGVLNIAKREDIKKKISEGVKASYTPELRKARSLKSIEIMSTRNPHANQKPYLTLRGDIVYSSLEQKFANLLFRNKISYEIQKSVRMRNGHTKIVDFVVNGVLIEVSGFAYKAWRTDFLDKIEVLRGSVDSLILLLTYPKYVQELMQASDTDILIGSIEDEERILQTLQFCNQLSFIKKEFAHACNF